MLFKSFRRARIRNKRKFGRFAHKLHLTTKVFRAYIAHYLHDQDTFALKENLAPLKK